MPTKKPHIIPQFYLRGFSANGRQVWIFDKSSGFSFISSIKDAATEAGFYASELLVKESGDKDVTEKILQAFENPVSKELRDFVLRIEEGDTSEITAGEAAALFGAVRGLWLRSKEFRAVMLEFEDKSNKALMRESGITDDLSDFRILPKSESELHLRWILDEKLGMKLFDEFTHQNLVVYRSDSHATPFYTSDSPVVCTQGAPAAKNNVTFFPLSSHVLLAMYEHNSFPSFFGKHRKIENASHELIRHSNRLQVMNSVRQVICGWNDFEVCQQICEENPHFRDPERERSRISTQEGLLIFERLPLI
jgi:Protein of unknown function (DUF4238)